MFKQQNHHRTVPKSFCMSQVHLWVTACVGVWSERHTANHVLALWSLGSHTASWRARERESRRALRQDLLIVQDVRGHAHEAGAMELGAVSILSDYVKSLKVADLKEHIKAFNERLPFCPHMRLSGNKTELAQRLTEAVLASCMNPLVTHVGAQTKIVYAAPRISTPLSMADHLLMARHPPRSPSWVYLHLVASNHLPRLAMLASMQGVLAVQIVLVRLRRPSL